MWFLKRALELQAYGPELSSDAKVQDFRVGDYVMRVPYRGSVFMNAQSVWTLWTRWE